jgi:transglutaminase-like putative cysteine protease
MAVFKIHHITRYQYDSPVKESINEMRIIPYQCQEQELLQHQLLITNNPPVHLFADYWGNTTGSFNVLAPHRELVIESKLIVRSTNPAELNLNTTSGFDELEAEVDSQLNLVELATFDHIGGQDAILQIVRSIHSPEKSIANIVKESCEYIFREFQYIKGITSRYVSGYICPNKNGMRGEGATHAWVEALIPGFGWAGVDPTNNVWVTDKHVKLAVGRNFNDCSPMKGTFKGLAEQKLSVYVSVGYEDGHMFEELNDVNLPVTKKIAPQVAAQAQQ